MLHGILLRDGIPLAIHTDHARELVGKAMTALARTFGIQQSSTLGHHPTGNATMERTCQYVTKCLRMMTAEQYSNWPDYVRLIEHTHNTTQNRVLGCTPFQAAHGLPARSAVDCIATTGNYSQPKGPDGEGITALSDTAQAFAEAARMTQTRERTAAAAAANNKGTE